MHEQSELSFVDLISPIGVAEFFANIWEKRVEIVSRGSPDHFRGCLTIGDVDRAIASLGLSFPDVRLVNTAGAPETNGYTRPDGRIIPTAVMQLFADGATIVLNQMHRHFDKLAALCRALECELGFAFQTNLYLSPPHSGGFKVHYDTHDVFVMQLSGYKEWELYESPLELPLPGQHHDETPVQPGNTTSSFKLNQGDLAYIPRGIYHSARSGDVQSLHITLGALPKTWSELMIEAVAELSQRDIEFRRALPIGFGVGRMNLKEAKQIFDRLLRRASVSADFERVAAVMAREFIRSRDAGALGQLAEVAGLGTIGLGTVVARRPDLLFLVAEQADQIDIQLAQTTIQLPMNVKSALTQLLSGRPIVVSDIAGPLDDAGKIVLAKRLVKEGVLRTIAPD